MRRLVAVASILVTVPTVPAISLAQKDISGTVTSAHGLEAGVWVIAETTELPTKFVRIVVTDDHGRYLIPDLPKAKYRVWVRGYGLIDSPKHEASPGRPLDLTAVLAPSPGEAAAYYPAGYWFSLLKPPARSEFPGTGEAGNGINPAIKSQAEWLSMVKSTGCTACHQLGTKGTREIPEAFRKMDPVAAWSRRILSGQAGGDMAGTIARLGLKRATEVLADWTTRIANGEVPPAPPRPKGIERNVVITEWDWADPKAYMHDEVSTDHRKPTVNAFGSVYGSTELSRDYLPVLDPGRNASTTVKIWPRDSATPFDAAQTVAMPSPYWGTEPIWNGHTNVHNPMMDAEGRVWITATVRPRENPEWCKKGSSLLSAQLFPIEASGRQLAMYDPKTGKLTHINTCFSTHHLMFAEDANNTLWTSGGGSAIGWLDTKKFLETGDEQTSQGWTAIVLDTDGDGKRSPYVEPGDPVDPTKDKRVNTGIYSVAVSPDGAVWGTSLGFPGAVVRVVPGDNPAATALAEVYQPPLVDSATPVAGFSPRGGDVDRNGVFWAALASGQLASFDRRKCKGPLNGPKATGQHCPEGWSFYTEPLPQMKGVAYPGSAEASYYTWVDQFDVLGLGANTPINTGNASEALLALKDGKFVVLRVPYPMGFYTKWMDGRIDDPNAGWKGRGLWATVSTRAPFHMEGGKGTTSKVVHFQLRPDPLAK